MERNRELIDDTPIHHHEADPILVLDEDDGWAWQDTGNDNEFDVLPNEYFVSRMQDWISEGKWKYNDCYHKSARGAFLIAPWPGLTGDTYVFASDPTTYDKGSVVSRYFLRPLIEAAKLQATKRVDSIAILEAFPLFRDSSLPHDISISRDPFETDFSVWYAVVDLIQLIGSFGLKGFVSSGRLLQSTKRARQLGIHTRPYKARTAKDLADAHLAVRFGVLPTIEDAGDLVSMVKRWVLTYDRVKKILRDRFRKHSHANLTARDAQFQDWEEIVMINPGYGASTAVTVKIVVKQKVFWHGLALYGFTCPYFQGWLARLKQIIDSFGIADPAALWDVVPFSFIVDWFFTTQNWLHSLKPKLFPATAIIYDYLETISHEVSVSYYLSWFGPSEPVSLWAWQSKQPVGQQYTDVYCGSETYKTYVRKRFVPTAVLGAERGPSLKKSFVRCNRVAVSASLLAQRVPR